jgi:hypothetical protein
VFDDLQSFARYNTDEDKKSEEPSPLLVEADIILESIKIIEATGNGNGYSTIQ